MSSKMDKSMIGHWLAAGVACVAAYVAWSRPAQSSDEAEVVVVAGSSDRLTEVRWDEESHEVVVGRDGDGAVVAVTSKKANANTQEAANAGLQFPGTEKATELFGTLAPLRAARSLGRPDEARLKSLGLDKPAASLTLRFGERSTRVAVGNTTYGSGNYYVQPEGGEVYLMPASSFAPLKQGAPTLVDRNAVAATREHIERVVVESGSGKRELVHRNADDRAKSFFADPAEPETKLEQATTWVDKVLRLRVVSLSTEAPAGEPALTVSFYDGRTLLQELSLWSDGAEHVTARSSRFKQPMKIAKSSVESILRDVQVVLSEGRSSP